MERPEGPGEGQARRNHLQARPPLIGSNGLEPDAAVLRLPLDLAGQRFPDRDGREAFMPE